MLVPGSYLGRYLVRQHLGAGGMGDVYLALDPTLDRQVAIKVLPDAAASDPNRLARFLREAKAVSALNHPNILTVHDFGHDEATHFLVTEFVDGRTLRVWSAEERPQLVNLLEVVAQAASALATAHTAGIVHRDVKPENLMLRHDGLVKVLDFGIAKLTAARSAIFDGDATEATQPQTAQGAILGTVRYMSPEQAEGLAIDATSDVWSLGVVLYELIAGRPPFRGATPMGTLGLILAADPEPLARAAPGTPEAVCHIVERALRRTPAERFETAAEMSDALQRAARQLRPAAARDASQDHVATMSLEPPGKPELAGQPPSGPNNLVPPTSKLIGRRRELDELAALLREADVRLVTLTGPGGTGKTRLAVEVARDMRRDFRDGVFAVDLSVLSDSEQVADHIAGAFDIEESAGSTLAAALERHLADKHLMLVLDNFEHLLAAAPYVTRLLAAAPDVKVLVTSRELLNLSQEREYAVEPLEVPVFTSLEPLNDLAGTPALALFIERAREAKPSFTLTPDNAPAVVEICRRLDGLPLALELAAVRMKLLSPTAMLDRLDRRLKLLTGGARDRPARQQTMRGAVAWSYELLEDDEKKVLKRIAVFAGGASLAAVEAVCAEDEIDVLDAVSSLVDKSLLRQRDLEDDEVRFTMLEVVREFALEQLEASDETESARLCHARHFRDLAKAAAPKLNSAEQGAWLGRLTRENDNLKAALSAMLDDEPDEGRDFVTDLTNYWLSRGQYREVQRWFGRALEGASIPAVRVRLLSGLSDSSIRLGNLDAALVHARAAVDASRDSGDLTLLRRSLSALGFALLFADDLAGAREALEEGLAIYHETGTVAGIWDFYGNLGELARRAGDYPAARAYYEQALTAAGGDVPLEARAVALGNLGGLSLEEGDAAGASRYYRDSLLIASKLGNVDFSTNSLDGLAAVAFDEGNRVLAARLAGAVEAVCETQGISREPWEQSLRDRYVSALRASLDGGTLEREWAKGRTMTLEEAVDQALGE